MPGSCTNYLNILLNVKVQIFYANGFFSFLKKLYLLKFSRYALSYYPLLFFTKTLSFIANTFYANDFSAYNYLLNL